MSDEKFLPYKSPELEPHNEPFKPRNWSRVSDAIASACIGALVIGGIGFVFAPIALLVLCVITGDFGGPAGLVVSLFVVGAVGCGLGAVIGSVIGLFAQGGKRASGVKNLFVSDSTLMNARLRSISSLVWPANQEQPQPCPWPTG